MYPLLDALLYIFHVLVMLVNLAGWVRPVTRKLQRYTFGATVLSWLLPGAWYGFGYCFLTDWHWQVRRAMGEYDLPYSFIQLIARDLGCGEISTGTSDMIAVTGLSIALIGCAWGIYRDKKTAG